LIVMRNRNDHHDAESKFDVVLCRFCLMRLYMGEIALVEKLIHLTNHTSTISLLVVVVAFILNWQQLVKPSRACLPCLMAISDMYKPKNIVRVPSPIRKREYAEFMA
jgi:hypothetical protein